MPNNYIDHDIDGVRIDGAWRQEVQRGNIGHIPNRFRMGARNAANESISIRNAIKTLIFNSNV